MFNRNNTSGEYVTREEARTVVDELTELTERVSRLESLAAQLRRGEAPLPVRGGNAHRVAASDALTKADAERALNGLRDAVRTEFTSLGDKVDIVAAMLQRASGQAPVTGARVAATTSVSTGVDYGAVAFGLSEIKRKVAEINNDNFSTDDDTLRREYSGTVQFFADTFKADPAFNEAEFKRQAGVGNEGNGQYDRPHP